MVAAGRLPFNTSDMKYFAVSIVVQNVAPLLGNFWAYKWGHVNVMQFYPLRNAVTINSPSISVKIGSAVKSGKLNKSSQFFSKQCKSIM